MAAADLAPRRGERSGPEGLETRLNRAHTVKAACAAVIEHLAGDESFMPSVYLLRGGRLRCQAVARYWQVFDGMPPGVGVIGTTYLNGRPTIVEDIAASDAYLEAVPSVRGEVCVPVRLAGVPIGVLNVESERPLDPGAVQLLEESAESLALRIEELGGLPDESRSERLVRHASRIAGLVDSELIRTEVLRAALDIAEMESALLAEADGAGGLRVTAAGGPHAPALRALDASALAQVRGWIDSKSSVYTIGEPAGRGFTGHEALRDAGAEALIVLPLGGSGELPGFLLLTDSNPIGLDTEDVELLELLAAQATSCLGTAAAVAQLRRRAESDALTGLGHHAAFHDALDDACRSDDRRGDLALLVIDVDGFKAVNDSSGHQAGDELLVTTADALRSRLRAEDSLFRIGGDEFAAIVRVRDEREGLGLAEELRAAVAEVNGPTISVGVTVAEPGESATRVFDRADAALYGVKHSGRDGARLA